MKHEECDESRGNGTHYLPSSLYQYQSQSVCGASFKVRIYDYAAKPACMKFGWGSLIPNNYIGSVSTVLLETDMLERILRVPSRKAEAHKCVGDDEESGALGARALRTSRSKCCRRRACMPTEYKIQGMHHRPASP